MTALIKLSDRFTETGIDDEIVIMRLDNGEFFSMSGTGAAIWRLIDGERGAAELRKLMSTEYGPDEGQIAEDVDEFLSRLKEAGLVAEA